MKDIRTIGSGFLNPINIYYQRKIRKNPYSFLSITGPNRRMVEYMLKNHNELVSRNPNIADSVICAVVKENPWAIKDFCEVPMEAVRIVARNHPNILRGLPLSDEMQHTLYNRHHSLLRYFSEPCDSIQYDTVSQDWKKIYELNKRGTSAYKAFLYKALGIISEPDEKVGKAIEVLIEKWDSINKEYKGETPVNVDTLPIHQKMKEFNFRSVPDKLRDRIYFERYKASIKEFQKSASLLIQPSGEICCFSEEGGLLRLEALKEALFDGDNEQIPTDNRIYITCLNKFMGLDADGNKMENINREISISSGIKTLTVTKESVVLRHGSCEEEKSDLTQLFKEQGINPTSVPEIKWQQLLDGRRVDLGNTGKQNSLCKTVSGYGLNIHPSKTDKSFIADSSASLE